MVERRRLPSVTTFHAEGSLESGAMVALPEGAAHHVRVKRMNVGDDVRVTDGRGRVAQGSIHRIARASVEVAVRDVMIVERPVTLVLHPPVGDRDRMLWLAEKATELAVTAWKPVVFHRSRSVAPRGEGEAFQARIRARMVSALEQSGGAWLPEIHPVTDVATAAHDTAMPVRYLLDAGGSRLDASDAATGAAVILGPEGGLQPEERTQLVAAGWRPVALASTILRFETAAVAAVAAIRAAHVQPRGPNA